MRRFAPIVALLLLLGLSACTTESEDTGHSLEDTGHSLEDTGHSLLAVFLDSDVTAETKGAVEQRLRSMPNVEEVALETREQAYESWKESLKDRPDVLADLKPESVPESFRASVTDASIAEAVELVMSRVDGVADVALRTGQIDPLPSHIGVIVRLKSTVTDEQKAAVEKAVLALPNVESVAYEASDAAYDRLRKQCQGKGNLATQLDRQMTLPSLRFRMPLDPQGKGLSDLPTFDGVDVVRLAPVAML
ncbi:permease-like cell division protein FtsX [Micromonospora zamorensis]|uniref:permease-like cell division protein FtsX n=1 Tax=Micromonospora zamorensis TaxID=709883 RepID=UPI00369ABA23